MSAVGEYKMELEYLRSLQEQLEKAHGETRKSYLRAAIQRQEAEVKIAKSAAQQECEQE